MKKKPKKPGPPPFPPEEKRTKMLGLKFTPAEFATIKTLTPAEMRDVLLTAARRKR